MKLMIKKSHFEKKNREIVLQYTHNSRMLKVNEKSILNDFYTWKVLEIMYNMRLFYYLYPNIVAFNQSVLSFQFRLNHDRSSLAVWFDKWSEKRKCCLQMFIFCNNYGLLDFKWLIGWLNQWLIVVFFSLFHSSIVVIQWIWWRLNCQWIHT